MTKQIFPPFALPLQTQRGEKTSIRNTFHSKTCFQAPLGNWDQLLVPVAFGKNFATEGTIAFYLKAKPAVTQIG